MLVHSLAHSLPLSLSFSLCRSLSVCHCSAAFAITVCRYYNNYSWNSRVRLLCMCVLCVLSVVRCLYPIQFIWFANSILQREFCSVHCFLSIRKSSFWALACLHISARHIHDHCLRKSDKMHSSWLVSMRVCTLNCCDDQNNGTESNGSRLKRVQNMVKTIDALCVPPFSFSSQLYDFYLHRNHTIQIKCSSKFSVRVQCQDLARELLALVQKQKQNKMK